MDEDDNYRANRREAKSKGSYILGVTLGEGAFGKVKVATHIHTQEKVAIKILDKTKMLQDEDDLKRVYKEISIMKKLKHKNIIQLYEIMESRKNLYLVMEYCEEKELFDYIVLKKRLTEMEACKFFQEIIDAVEYLHSMNICHRDLKPENLLLDHKKSIKLSDFGLSSIYESGNLLATPCGTPSYAPPEMLKGEEYNGLASDLWSCGVILYAMVCGYLPFSSRDEEEICNKIIEGKFSLPEFVSPQVKDLIKNILNGNPEERFGLDQIKNHPWFNIVFPRLRPGINLNTMPYPIDEEILNEVGNYGFEKDKVKQNLIMNKYDSVTSIYFLVLRRNLKLGKTSISDLESNDYMRYMGYEIEEEVKKENNVKIKKVKSEENNKDEQIFDQKNEIVIAESLNNKANNKSTPRKDNLNINNGKSDPNNINTKSKQRVIIHKTFLSQENPGQQIEKKKFNLFAPKKPITLKESNVLLSPNIANTSVNKKPEINRNSFISTQRPTTADPKKLNIVKKIKNLTKSCEKVELKKQNIDENPFSLTFNENIENNNQKAVLSEDDKPKNMLNENISNNNNNNNKLSLSTNPHILINEEFKDIKQNQTKKQNVVEMIAKMLVGSNGNLIKSIDNITSSPDNTLIGDEVKTTQVNNFEANDRISCLIQTFNQKYKKYYENNKNQVNLKEIENEDLFSSFLNQSLQRNTNVANLQTNLTKISKRLNFNNKKGDIFKKVPNFSFLNRNKFIDISGNYDRDLDSKNNTSAERSYSRNARNFSFSPDSAVRPIKKRFELLILSKNVQLNLKKQENQKNKKLYSNIYSNFKPVTIQPTTEEDKNKLKDSLFFKARKDFKPRDSKANKISQDKYTQNLLNLLKINKK